MSQRRGWVLEQEIKKSYEKWQKNLAEMEEGLLFKQSSLTASNQQPSKGAPTVQATINLK